MSWNLSIYVEGKSGDGSWRLVSHDSLYDSAKDIIVWDDCDGHIGFSECSDGLLHHFYDSYLGRDARTFEQWKTDCESSYSLRVLNVETVKSWYDAVKNEIDRVMYALFSAGGCHFSQDEYADYLSDYEPVDEDGESKKGWNPLTYPFNKEILRDLQDVYFRFEKLGMYKMLLSIAETRSYFYENVRFIVLYS